MARSRDNDYTRILLRAAAKGELVFYLEEGDKRITAWYREELHRQGPYFWPDPQMQDRHPNSIERTK